jgi:hypothetical protein
MVDGLAMSQLSGNGVHGAIGISPKSLNFPGRVPIGQTRTKTVTLTNKNPVGLVVSAILPTDQFDFSASQNCVGTLGTGPNATCQITVTFKPVAPGKKTARLGIADAAGSGSQEVSLSGTGK